MISMKEYVGLLGSSLKRVETYLTIGISSVIIYFIFKLLIGNFFGIPVNPIWILYWVIGIFLTNPFQQHRKSKNELPRGKPRSIGAKTTGVARNEA